VTTAGEARRAALVDGRIATTPEPRPAGERGVVLAPDRLPEAVALLTGAGARLVGLLVAERPGRSLLAALAHRGELVVLRAPIGEATAYPALGAVVPAAIWDERALRDLEAVEPEGLPDPAPMAWPDPDRPRRLVAGPEVQLMPYGPIRSGVFESIQYAIETGGEDVLALEVRPMFKRRNLEGRVAGMDVAAATAVAERTAGIAGVAHAMALAQGVERALGIAVPERGQLWRATHAELERIANHLDVAVRLAEDAALSVAVARFGILKEEVMRLRAALCGSRFGRGVVVPGGIAAEPLLSPDEVMEALRAINLRLRRDRRLLLRTTSFTDRLIGTGRLDRGTVERLAGVGPVARATGAAIDVRLERPYCAYARLGFRVVTADDGDAMARLEVRFGEVRQSLHMLRQALDRLRRVEGPLAAGVPPGSGAAFGWAEAPQGELLYWVEAAAGRVERVRVCSPSFRNWPLMAASFRGDVLTDFSFIEHSFGLTPAGADR
jgi:Ni,Fe-hydrogenase III large subunit